MNKRVCVIGGGISGLSASYFALKKGYSIDLFEQSNQLGGLASSFDFDGLIIDKFYHFICGGDRKLISFAGELGINEKLRFNHTKSAFYYCGKYYSFSTISDLLRFTPISFLSRFRFGINILYSKVRKKWEHLDYISAKKWLINAYGKNAYSVIWHPLLSVKFSKFHNQLSASWIWHRIHRLANSREGIFLKEKLGYLEGSSFTLIDTIKSKILQMRGNIHLNIKVDRLERIGNKLRVFFYSDKYDDFDIVILAVPLPIASEIIKKLDPKFSDQLSSIKFIGIVCGVLRLKHGISEAFWLNINDSRIAANGLIEYTNLNPLEEIKPDKIIYFPFYLPHEATMFTKNENALKEDFFNMLKIIRPNLTNKSIVNFKVFKSHYAQAIFPVGFKNKIPSVKTPVENLFLLDSALLYPQDRFLSALIKLAENTVDQYF